MDLNDKAKSTLKKSYENKVNSSIDNASEFVEKKYRKSIEYGKNVRYGIKFFVECLLTLPKEVKSYISDKN